MLRAMPVSEREALELRVDELSRETERLDAELAARRAEAAAPLEQHLAALRQALDSLAGENRAKAQRLQALRHGTWQLERDAGPEGRSAWAFRQGLALGAWLGGVALAWTWLGLGAAGAWFLSVPAAALAGHLAGRAR